MVAFDNRRDAAIWVRGGPGLFSCEMSDLTQYIVLHNTNYAA